MHTVGQVNRHVLSIELVQELPYSLNISIGKSNEFYVVTTSSKADDGPGRGSEVDIEPYLERGSQLRKIQLLLL